MINSKQLLQDFISRIALRADTEEIAGVAYLVMDKLFNVSRTDILREKEITAHPDQLQALDGIAKRINSNEPIQYILQEAFFFGRKFFVDRAVLIPRPETEELVSLVIENCEKRKIKSPTILDIGTGSGCIPITLSLELRGSKVYGLDKSESALVVAKRNAQTLNADVAFLQADILSPQLSLENLDIIVSNPPYIPFEEKGQIRANVTDFEPHIALFVDDHDPLMFYSAIADFGKKSLSPTGFIAVEINERFGRDTKNVFDNAGYSDTQIIKDLSGKNRFVVANK
jgi:release factor glutamine methyltransferase